MAQGPKWIPLKYNYSLTENHFSAISSITTDTLDLPFFDDFAYQGPSPDARLWCDQDVFVNNTFSVNQITHGMATFDHLDSNGAPYNFLSRFAISGADTLTSLPINLFDRDIGGNNVAYNISDSIMLSFFVETGGLGDAPENDDSLKLEFKDSNGNWNLIWFINDNATDSFEQFFAVIKDTRYLHNSFQFRILNVTKNSGNMNHFHLDYVQMNEGRTQNEVIQDVSLTVVPPSLFSIYKTLPYAHFQVNPGTQLNNNRVVAFKNNLNNAVFISVQAEVYDEDNNQIYIEPFASRNINVSAKSSASVQYPSFTIPSLTGDSTFLRSVYRVNSLGNDVTEKNTYNSLHDNNVIEGYDFFHQYYAYDDGSAEAGFGLDYGGLPDGPAFCAMEFTNLKQDSLHGIDIHFNRALEEVGNRPITLMIWQDIANGGGSDIVIREIQTSPTYVNEKNGFARFELDTNIVLPAGKFYIGWRQNSAYIANIGYDKNYTGTAAKVFYNFTGSWVQLGSGFEGTLMMRPLIGKKLKNVVSNPKVKDLNHFHFNVYPNPSDGKVHISTNGNGLYQIFNMQGALMNEGRLNTGINSFNIETKGMYICLLKSKNGTLIETKKIIIK